MASAMPTDNVENMDMSEAEQLQQSAAMEYAPFSTQLQFLAWIHFHGGDTTREFLPQALLADDKGISSIIGKSDDEVQTILRPYKTIMNTVANINPLVTPRMFKDAIQKQCLSWVSHAQRTYYSFCKLFFCNR